MRHAIVFFLCSGLFTFACSLNQRHCYFRGTPGEKTSTDSHSTRLVDNSQGLWAQLVSQILSALREPAAWDRSLLRPDAPWMSDTGLKSPLVSSSAIGQMIFAWSQAPEEARDLDHARKLAQFLQNHMLRVDDYGFYFTPYGRFVQGQFENVPTLLVAHEQALSWAGLLALYKADPLHSAHLLDLVRKGSEAFWQRFYDPLYGGLAHGALWNASEPPTSRHLDYKSAQSVIVSLVAFLLELHKSDVASRPSTTKWIAELVSTSQSWMIGRQGGQVTGWLNERIHLSGAPDASVTTNQTGGIAQMVWVLGEAARLNIPLMHPEQPSHLETAKELLSLLLSHGALDSSKGCVYGVFETASQRPFRYANGQAPSYWWSQLEVITSLETALERNWFRESKQKEDKLKFARDLALQCYLQFFLNSEKSEEIWEIDAETGEELEDNKTHVVKTPYHLVRAFHQLESSKE